MTPYLAAIEAALALVLLTVAVAVGYHFGGMAPRAELEAQHAEWAESTTQALLAQRTAQEAESARINKAVSDYENTPLDPITVGISHRVFKYAAGADCPVLKPAAVAAGTEAPAAVPIGHSSVESALGDVLTACAQDAAQLKAMIELAP